VTRSILLHYVAVFALISLVGCSSVTSSAGNDQTVFSGEDVWLSGSGTSGENSGTMTYTWLQISGIPVDLDDDASPTARFKAPAVDESEPLIFELTVKSNFGRGSIFSKDQVTVVVTPSTLPEISAGEDRSGVSGEVATLTAITSAAEDSAQWTYEWTQVSGPAVSLGRADSADLSVVLPRLSLESTVVFAVTVTTANGESTSDEIEVTVTPAFDPPKVSINGDNEAYSGVEVTLAATSSTDPAGGQIDYTWEVLRGDITIDEDKATEPAVTVELPDVDEAEVVTVQVTGVSSTSGLSSTQSFDILVEPYPQPKANAGADMIVTEGDAVTLNGSLSSDPAGGELTYKWTIPSGISLSSASSIKPVFVAPPVTADQIYTFTLQLTNAQGDVDTASVRVTVRESSTD
jgi:hypothetical protein